MVRREDLAKSIADVVTAVPGVASLHPGSGIEVATHYSGGKVVGVRLSGETVDIYITADDVPLPDVAAAAAAAAGQVLTAVGDTRAVNVVVADLAPGALDRRQGSRG